MTFACGTTDTPGCVMYADGTCSCARGAGVAGSCSACAQKRKGAGADMTTPVAFPIWPIAVVGVLAVGIFVATLSINKKR